MANNTENPLSRYYRTARLSVQLPSRGLYYPEDSVVELGSDGEVSVLPMTAQDEIHMKNPDALLNGEAVTSLIRSCVPQVRNARKLLSCDVDALMVAIRAASYGENSEVEAVCPECSAENSYTIDYEALLADVEPLEPQYDVPLGNGVTVTVTPAQFESSLRQQKAIFEGSKVQRILTDQNISDEARLQAFSAALKKITKMNFEMIVESVSQAVFTDDEGRTQTVSDRRHIVEFLNNIESADADLIEKAIVDINSHGVKKSLDTACRNCGHQWSVPVEFNDTNFFLGS